MANNYNKYRMRKRSARASAILIIILLFFNELLLITIDFKQTLIDTGSLYEVIITEAFILVESIII